MESAEYVRAILNSLKGKRYANISQLAEQAGVGQGNLSEFMKGKRNQISFDTVWRLFVALGIELPNPSDPQPSSSHSWEKERIRELERELAKTEGKLESLENAISRGWIDSSPGDLQEKSGVMPGLKSGAQDAG